MCLGMSLGQLDAENPSEYVGCGCGRLDSMCVKQKSQTT